ncbi:MAG: histidine triad nucleotide-binding protein [Candidatus Marinimicrobia bacterium]|jgi:histidine triad (HIT) family protein|nr:histidine triad nucleotide-binding protein [Candidatus Neomarinimicrobiota bacterium]MEC7871777.1 histidine triad nucleotide-binding protein [Candidatus Neomarinimicrobiota bacterium]|tara:strand:- start:70 stop:414 length:345 start_codon:yes stop_codon:yes gene_type:complete
MDKCLFCEILDQQIPCSKVFENDQVFAFDDIDPHAPIHVLIIPKKHIKSINEIKNEDKNLIGAMFIAAKEIARIKGIKESGYRTVFNTNQDAGQTVFHIHMHVIGGRKMKWPPG